MSDVEFDEENTLTEQMPKQVENVSSMTKFVMKTGLVKNKSQVSVVLFILTICLFSFAIYIIVKFVI